MKEQRRLGICEECGAENVKMATTTACFTCYQRARRANSREPDLHNPSLRKEHVKLVKQYSKLLEVFAALKVNDDTKNAVMLHIRPYFHTIEHLVNLGVGTANEPSASEPTDADDDDDDEQRARLARIFSAPVVKRVISDDDLTALPTEPRAELEREVLECYERHRANWTIPPDGSPEEFLEKHFNASGNLHAFSHEILQIAARHGVPRAIAALKGEMSPEMKKATAFVKKMRKGSGRLARPSER